MSDQAHALGASFGQRSCVAQVLGHANFVTREGRFGESKDLHRRRGSRGLDLLALVVDESLDLAEGGSGDHGIAHAQQPLLDHHRRDRSPAHFEIGFEHGARRSTCWSRLEFGEFGY